MVTKTQPDVGDMLPNPHFEESFCSSHIEKPTWAHQVHHMWWIAGDEFFDIKGFTLSIGDPRCPSIANVDRFAAFAFSTREKALQINFKGLLIWRVQ